MPLLLSPTTFTPQLVGALAMFAFASSITPGPNNTMLLSSGARFGFGPTRPHILGVVAGFLGLILLVGLGLGGVFAAYPWLHAVLKWAGAIYLLYLAWKIASSRTIGSGKAEARPMTFGQAAAFQAVNPKGWAMAVGAVATYVPSSPSVPGYVANMVLATVVVGVINAPCIIAWAGFGVGLRRFLDRPGVLRAFNIAMAILLVASLAPLALELLPRQ